MKKVILIFFLESGVFVTDAQSLILKWAKQVGGTGFAGGSAVVTDVSRNVFTAGYFSGTGDFDPGPGIYDLTSNNPYRDVFISKLDSAGNFIWAMQIGGAGLIANPSIALDASGNIYIKSRFDGTIDADPGTGTYNLTGNADDFIIKLGSGGNFIWAKQFHLNSQPYSELADLATDANGNVFAIGYFSGTADFDPGPGVTSLTVSGSGVNSFVCKLNATGNLIWAKQIAGNVPQSYSIDLDSLGNIYMAGFFGGPEPTDFDPGPGVYNLAGFNTTAFVLKLSNDGNFIWAKKMGAFDNSSSADGMSLALDGCGNVYTGGRFNGTIDFDPGQGIYSLSANGSSDIFVAKLDNNGSFIWAKHMGSTGATAYAYSIATDPYGNVFSTGYFSGQVDFDPGPGVYNIIGTGGEFLSELDPNGNFVWAKQFDYNNTNYTITTDAFGNVFTTGYFDGTVNFDPGLGVYNLTPIGMNDVFIHKMGPCISGASSISVTTCKPYRWSYRVRSGCNNTATQTDTLLSSGVYTGIVAGGSGCDSIITLYLTINRIHQDISVSACNTFTWQGRIYDRSGVYTDTAKTADGCDSVITLHLTINPGSFSTITKTICDGQSYEGYRLSGIYSDSFTAANGCDSIRTLNLTVLTTPAPDLGADKELCSGDSLVLSPGQFSSYAWQDGSSENQFIVKHPGIYSVLVTNSCGTGGDQISIKEGICDFYFPSGFTPNNDGKNDFFKILGSRNLKEYHLAVYNRWGQKIFETNDPEKSWNGDCNGRLQPSATFVWYCEFRKLGDAGKTKLKGAVTLIR